MVGMRRREVNSYLLTRHAYTCVVNDCAIVLDLRSDRYYGLGQDQTRALSLMVQGWPAAASLVSDNELLSRPENEQLADELIDRGILTLDASIGKKATSVEVPKAQARLHEWNAAERVHIGSRHVFRMGLACSIVGSLLRLRQMAQIVERVSLRKRAATVHMSSANLETTRDCLRPFLWLRPFFYSVRNRCLFDSLVLLEYLAAFEVFPTWVIGVKTPVFAAHSWVQMDQYVLNGPPEYVQAYSPILTV